MWKLASDRNRRGKRRESERERKGEKERIANIVHDESTYDSNMYVVNRRVFTNGEWVSSNFSYF